MNAIALNSSIFNAARAIGPAIAGLLISGLGTAFCFFVNGLSFLAVIAGPSDDAWRRAPAGPPL